jgi:hypothetical protein
MALAISHLVDTRRCPILVLRTEMIPTKPRPRSEPCVKMFNWQRCRLCGPLTAATRQFLLIPARKDRYGLLVVPVQANVGGYETIGHPA